MKLFSTKAHKITVVKFPIQLSPILYHTMLDIIYFIVENEY